MRKQLACIGTFALALCLSGTSAFAHEEHCHLKGADGKLEDAKDVTTKKACTQKGGTWFHHHQHCHKADTAGTGKMVDVKDAKDEKACTEKGGTWTDHGHDKAAQPAATK